MEKYFMIKTEGHVLVITIMQCPESNVVCLECDTEEEVYRLIRKMDCEITFGDIPDSLFGEGEKLIFFL